MEIFTTTDSNIDAPEKFTHWVNAEVSQALSQFGASLTRVDAHLKSEGAGADNIACVLEAHVAGLQPLAASHHAATPGDAVTGAAAKLKRVLDSTLGRMREHRGTHSVRDDGH